MIRTILYASDLGLQSPYVLQHALSLSRAYDAQIHVIHVVEPLGIFAEAVLTSYLDSTALKNLKEQGLGEVMAGIEARVMEAFQEELGDFDLDADAIGSLHVTSGDPPCAILQQAEQIAADIIVVGAHNSDRNFPTPLGRTASHVVQTSPIPVYVVPVLDSSECWTE